MAVWKLPGVRSPEPGKATRVSIDGTPVAVFNINGRIYGVDAHCTHVGGPLDRGTVENGAVTCPLHGSQFDLVTGAVRRGPATQPVRAYRVRQEPDGLVLESD